MSLPRLDDLNVASESDPEGAMTPELAGDPGPTAAVVVCTHTFDRLPYLRKSLHAVLSGTRRPEELFVVVDNNPDLQAVIAREFTDEVFVLANDGRGVSDARNTALGRSTADVVVYLDDDAWPDAAWLAEMLAPFADSQVMGVGGRIVPAWENELAQLPPELYWVVGSTYAGHPEGSVAITRPIGASMAARRAVIQSAGGFSSEFGPSGGMKVSSNEELALFGAIRVVHGDDCVRFSPGAVVHHFAPEARTTWRYLVQRCRVEGSSKAELRDRFGGGLMQHDRSYIFSSLLPAAGRYARRGVRSGDRAALRGASQLVVALAVTSSAYLERRLARRLVPSRRAKG